MIALKGYAPHAPNEDNKPDDTPAPEAADAGAPAAADGGAP